MGLVLKAYQNLVQQGELQEDPAQVKVVSALDDLSQSFATFRQSNFLKRLFQKPSSNPAGLYIFGDVGRGKSMLMDLFFEHVPTLEKKRIHFHEFMEDVHGQLHHWRKLSPKELKAELGTPSLEDPLKRYADQLGKNCSLLCFDEFQVTDVADAMILGRLFDQIWQRGVTIVATSNRAPDDLYKDGLNRQLFLPFIETLKNRMQVLHLQGPRDYRLERMKGRRTYLTPVNEETTAELSETFFRLTDHEVTEKEAVPSDIVHVKGRDILVPKALKGVAVFSFKRLCEAPLGPSDYLAIARRYHTLFLVAIPKLSKERRNEARRFVNLIDALYEQKVKLFCSAEVAPDELYPEGDGSFEFQRTVSRLMEMQSDEYLKLGHGQ